MKTENKQTQKGVKKADCSSTPYIPLARSSRELHSLLSVENGASHIMLVLAVLQ